MRGWSQSPVGNFARTAILPKRMDFFDLVWILAEDMGGIKAEVQSDDWAVQSGRVEFWSWEERVGTM